MLSPVKMRTTIILFALGLLTASCKKENVFTNSPDARLVFSTDSVSFDTIFTGLSSTTARIRIFNTARNAVRISEIRLYGGSGSCYKMNVNGTASDYLENVKLQGGDSLTVFIKAAISPNSQKKPFLIVDSIAFISNGNRQVVRLTAYGQNVNVIKKAVISTNTIWDDQIPYLIYDTLLIPQNRILTIKKGCRVYFNKNAKLEVEGTLKVEGTLQEPVTFAGSRLERIYRNEAGQWGGIHFKNSSSENAINYAVIQNAVTGLRADASLPQDEKPKLLLTNSIIKNMQAAGIAAYNSSIAAFNNLMFNCGQYLIRTENGGSYNLKQNTFANYSFFFARYFPSLSFNTEDKKLNLVLMNNIIWGSLQHELEINGNEADKAGLQAENNIIRTTQDLFNSGNNIINIDPLFALPAEGNFKLKEESPAREAGQNLENDLYYEPFLSTDLLGTKRIFPSSAGCYNFF